MRSSAKCAGLAAAVGLTGSLVTGVSVASAAPAHEDGNRTRPLGQARPVPVEPRTAGRLGAPWGGQDDPGTPRVCRGLVPYPIPVAYRSYYFCGDWRLGPRHLPTRGLLGNILQGYHRTGGLTAVQFLNNWWDPTKDSGQGDWKYPPQDGFALDSRGKPIATTLNLGVGQFLDRFGNESGRFLSPAGTKYGRRAIPPSNLNTADPRYPFDYYLYKVAKAVKVCAGPAAPAFEQPGGAIQYATSSSACGNTVRVSVGDLVGNGTLVRVKVPYTDVKTMKHRPPAGVRTTIR